MQNAPPDGFELVVSWAHEAADPHDTFASADKVASLMAKHDILDLRTAPPDIRDMMEFARDWKSPQKPSLVGRLLGRTEKAPDPKQQEEEFLRLATTVAERYSNFMRP
jgi:hypothetical protein